MKNKKEIAVVILAAGKGTRMKSDLPKVLHKVCGQAMIENVLDAAEKIGVTKKIVVIGHGAEKVQKKIAKRAEFVLQEKLLGTGHAVQQTKQILKDFQGTIMVLCGDTPLLRGETLKRFYNEHCEKNNIATILSAFMPDAGYGRIVRNCEGKVSRIVECKDATKEELAIKEYNSGIFCFSASKLFNALSKINCENTQGEYYLTDVIKILAEEGEIVDAVSIEDYEETLGVNSKVQLAEAEAVLRLRILNKHMENGVTIMDPKSTFIDSDVKIGQDTVLYPFSWLEKGTIIGNECIIGPNVRLKEAVLGSAVEMQFTYAHECEIGDNVVIGPYVHLRPGSKIDNNVKIGNFVEIKNSKIGENSKVPHLSYIGDTKMGKKVNIGSGAITVNYDGKNKHKTIIEDEAFIGCNTNLVAPVVIGKNAYTGAGSTITKDVPEDALAIERSKQVNIKNWGAKKKS